MSPQSLSAAPKLIKRSNAGYFVLAGFVGFLGFCIIALIGCFHLSSETTILRNILISSVSGNWDKKFALRVGGITTGLVRLGSSFFHLPPEPRAAIEAVRGVDVGIYKLQDEPGNVERGAILTRADKAMAGRGWDRIVGVIQESELVAVYMPRKGLSPKRMKCCVLVFSGHDLVVASARVNLEPLLAIAEKHLDQKLDRDLLAWR